MKTTIEERLCYWKLKYDKDRDNGIKLGKNFESCISCEGYNTNCIHYTNETYYNSKKIQNSDIKTD